MNRSLYSIHPLLYPCRSLICHVILGVRWHFTSYTTIYIFLPVHYIIMTARSTRRKFSYNIPAPQDVTQSKTCQNEWGWESHFVLFCTLLKWKSKDVNLGIEIHHKICSFPTSVEGKIKANNSFYQLGPKYAQFVFNKINLCKIDGFGDFSFYVKCFGFPK